MRAINPATGRIIREYATLSLSEAGQRAERAARLGGEWARTPLSERARLLRSVASVLTQRREAYACLMAEEMGKPVGEGVAEVIKCASVCEYYAEHGAAMLEPERIVTEADRSYVCFEPLGVVLGIMPWNFPFWQFFRFAASSLLAGNAVLLKHASNVPGSAHALEDAFQTAGFAPGLVSNLSLGRDQMAALIAHDDIAAVTFTGSTDAGAEVAASAGRALKKCVLELGGSDPYVVLADADLELTLDACVQSRMLNNGQSCIAAKRFIVDRRVRADFAQGMLERLMARRVGDPLDPATDQGPLARVDLRDRVHEQLQASVSAGATLWLGGVVPTREGAWYPPTLISNVKPGMPAYHDEIFGPVAAIIEADDERDAVRIANDTSFGLGSAIFSRDVERAEHLARTELQAGSCFVNDFVRSDPRLPFGGIKRSGFGRELSSQGIREFVNAKTVSVRA